MVKGKPNKKHPHSKFGPKDRNDDKSSKNGEVNSKKEEKITKKEDKVVNSEKVPDHGVSGNNVGEVPSHENNIVDNESKKYAKRKIESNWHRYEEAEVDEHLIVEEEYDETKDFDYIRQNSASALSHFKFKEEAEWETDVHQTKDSEGNILGLNLAHLAANLQQYGLEEKLSLAAMIPEECKYCVSNVLQCAPKPEKLYSYKATNSRKNIKWSYEGIEKYKHSLGVVKGSDNSDENNIKHNSYNSANLNIDDDDLLNELLIDEISITSESRSQCVDIKSRHAVKNCRTNGTVELNLSEEELDLDMLLDMDSPICENKDLTVDGHTDSDLDQWLDEMLT